MDQILEWLGQYSAPLGLLLGFGAALIDVLQRVVEGAVQAELDSSNKHFLLKTPFHRLTNAEADLPLASVNAKSSEEWQRLAEKTLPLNDELREAMNQVFGIEAIRWDLLGGGAR